MDVNQQICGMDAVALARAIRSKELSPVEVVEAHLARIEALEPSIHAFCTITSQAAREQAREVETRILRGDDVGSLAGVPVGIKDEVARPGFGNGSVCQGQQYPLRVEVCAGGFRHCADQLLRPIDGLHQRM